MQKTSTQQSARDFFYYVWEVLKHPVTSLVLGILITVIFFYFDQKEIVARYAVTVPELLAEQTIDVPNLKLFWNAEEIKDISSVNIVIWNAGRQYLHKDAISKSDPLRVNIPRGIDVLYADFVQTSRGNLVFSTSFFPSSEDKQSILIQINGDEALEYQDGGVLRILFTGQPEYDFQIVGRIIGTKAGFQRSAWPSNGTPAGLTLLLLLLFQLPFYAFLWRLRLAGSFRRTMTILIIGAIAVLLLNALVSTYLDSNAIMSPLPWLAE